MTSSIDLIRIKHGTPFGHTTIEADLALVTFQEDESHIVYCPSLDLSEYGDSPEAALENFRKHLSMYFEYTIEEGTLWKDLRSHGWDIRSKKQKKTSAPSFSQLQERRPALRQIQDRGGYNISHQVISHQIAASA